MKLNLRSPHLVLFFLTKVSGYAFFSIKFVAGKFKFYKDSFDYVVMVASLAFSYGVMRNVIAEKSTITLRSIVLSIGGALSWNFLILTSSLTKVINVFAGRQEFLIYEKFSLVDEQVTRSRMQH